MFLYARFMKKTPPPKKARKGKKGKKGGNDQDKGGGKKKGDAKLKKHSDLPKHWEEHFDDDGTPYYFNTKTDEVRIARMGMPLPAHGGTALGASADALVRDAPLGLHCRPRGSILRLPA